MRVVVGSTSHIKLVAVATALESVGINDAICGGCPAESGISNQPVGKDQMRRGARARVRHAVELVPGADYYVAIESGLVIDGGLWFDPACVIVRNNEGHESIAFGTQFPIPEWLAERTFERGSELGVIVQELADGGEKDPMAYLSRGTISREELLSQAVRCALVPLLNRERYEKPR